MYVRAMRRRLMQSRHERILLPWAEEDHDEWSAMRPGRR